MSLTLHPGYELGLHRFQPLRRRVRDGGHRHAGIVVLGDEAAADEVQRVHVVHRVAQRRFDVEQEVALSANARCTDFVFLRRETCARRGIACV